MPLAKRVTQLIDTDPLIRMQAANVLRSDLEAGVSNVVAALDSAKATVELKAVILEWLKASDVAGLKPETQIMLRTCLADHLDSPSAEVRRHVAQTFRRFGPDEQRTRFLMSITD
ncbi:hypothetical protein OAU50_04780, partial [Planctomycetota bacterium]|nr:hypothetical protein [Planctomycetota bacterium]